MKHLYIVLISILCLTYSKVSAQNTKETYKDCGVRTTQYGIGYQNLLDTYLSPLEYSGMSFNILRENLHELNWQNRTWAYKTLFQFKLGYDTAGDGDSQMLSLISNWNISVYKKLPSPSNRVRMFLGPAANLHGGVVYNFSNGNNPASAVVYGDLGAAFLGQWDFRIKRIPFSLEYQANLPLLGCRFSPVYKQSYYEIFVLDNKSGTTKFIYPGNAPSLFQKVSLDIPISRYKLRLSYILDIQQSELNNLKTHIYDHQFMIGIVKHLYSKR